MRQIQSCSFLQQDAVLRPRSIVRQIKDSQALRDIFVGGARSQTEPDDLLAAVTDMSFAPQRLDPRQRPLENIVINLEELVSYCHMVVRDRGATSEGQGCERSLRF